MPQDFCESGSSTGGSTIIGYRYSTASCWTVGVSTFAVETLIDTGTDRPGDMRGDRPAVLHHRAQPHAHAPSLLRPAPRPSTARPRTCHREHFRPFAPTTTLRRPDRSGRRKSQQTLQRLRASFLEDRERPLRFSVGTRPRQDLPSGAMSATIPRVGAHDTAHERQHATFGSKRPAAIRQVLRPSQGIPRTVFHVARDVVDLEHCEERPR